MATRVWLLGVPAAAGALLAAGTVGYLVGSRDDGAGGSDAACVASDVAADALPAVVTIRVTT